MMANDTQLLALVRPLVPTMRRWKPYDGRMSINDMLRHVGSEPEQVQITQVHQILAEWRAHYLARLQAERAGLLWQLRGLSEESLLTSEVIPGWSIKNLAVHIAHYDAVHVDRMQKVVDGRTADIQRIAAENGLANYNAALLEQVKETPLEQAIAMLLKERSGFQALLKQIPDTDLHRSVALPWGQRTSMRVWANWRYRHDLAHEQQIAAWRAAQPVAQLRQVGPKFVLRALLQATRHEFMALLNLFPQPEWTTRPVCGTWTIKDLVGHLTDWERVAVEGMSQLAAGHLPEFAYELPDFDQFNNANAAQRKEQPWDEVWADYQSTRATLLTLLADTPETMLARRFTAPWGGDLTGYVWMLVWPGHEREHAVDVRAALQLLNWPKGLVKHR
jgi:uncharacterized protein (TIGR03083 family)